jgi:hypothetical protein
VIGVLGISAAANAKVDYTNPRTNSNSAAETPANVSSVTALAEVVYNKSVPDYLKMTLAHSWSMMQLTAKSVARVVTTKLTRLT